jgi:hypothetical protein
MNSFDVYQTKFIGKIPKYILRLMYNKIPKALVFMTCELECEERIKYLNRALESLNKQTVLPDAVFLVLITDYIDGKKTTLEFKPPETRFKLIIEEFDYEKLYLEFNDYIQKWDIYSKLFNYIKDDDVISFLHELDEFLPNKIEITKMDQLNKYEICRYYSYLEYKNGAHLLIRNADYSMNGKFMKKFYEVASGSDEHCLHISYALDDFYEIIHAKGNFLEISDKGIKNADSLYILLKLAYKDEVKLKRQYDKKSYY